MRILKNRLKCPIIDGFRDILVDMSEKLRRKSNLMLSDNLKGLQGYVLYLVKETTQS